MQTVGEQEADSGSNNKKSFILVAQRVQVENTHAWPAVRHKHSSSERSKDTEEHKEQSRQAWWLVTGTKALQEAKAAEDWAERSPFEAKSTKW